MRGRMYNPSGFPTNYRSFTFDIMSIDRNSTPPCLLVGNYEDDPNGLTYLAKWPLDGTNGRLATKTVDGNLVALANWGYRISILTVRGMFFAHKKYYIGQLAKTPGSVEIGDINERGQLWLWAPGEKVDPIMGVLPRGVGGLAYGPDGDDMWAVGSTDGSRGVVGIDAGGYVGESVPTPTLSKTSATSVPGPTSGAETSNTPGGTVGSKTNTGAIVGGVIGGIVAGALLLWLFVMYRRRKTARDAERQLTSQGADQYPPPGFAQGTDEYYGKGEIPTLKSELDASSTQVNHANYAATLERSTGSAEHIEALDEWEKKKAVARMPARKPTPMATPAEYAGRKGEGPWVELPAIEKPVQAP